MKKSKLYLWRYTQTIHPGIVQTVFPDGRIKNNHGKNTLEEKYYKLDQEEDLELGDESGKISVS